MSMDSMDFFVGPERHCQACGTDMPDASVRSFVDDGAVLYVCRADRSCEARRAAKAGTTETSTLLGANKRLTEWILTLEGEVDGLRVRIRALEKAWAREAALLARAREAALKEFDEQDSPT